jgi:hypothetical protein
MVSSNLNTLFRQQQNGAAKLPWSKQLAPPAALRHLSHTRGEPWLQVAVLSILADAESTGIGEHILKQLVHAWFGARISKLNGVLHNFVNLRPHNENKIRIADKYSDKRNTV